MIVVSKETLEEFERFPACEWCKKANRAGLDAHHLRHRGLDDGARIDARCNLVALCRECHTAVHAGKIDRYALLAIVAEREGLEPGDAQVIVWELLRMPKRTEGVE